MGGYDTNRGEGLAANLLKPRASKSLGAPNHPSRPASGKLSRALGGRFPLRRRSSPRSHPGRSSGRQQVASCWTSTAISPPTAAGHDSLPNFPPSSRLKISPSRLGPEEVPGVSGERTPPQAEAWRHSSPGQGLGGPEKHFGSKGQQKESPRQLQGRFRPSERQTSSLSAPGSGGSKRATVSRV